MNTYLDSPKDIREPKRASEPVSADVARQSRKTIKFYTHKGFEFIHPECRGDAMILAQLTGKTHINSVVRELIRDLTEGQIQWIESPRPLNFSP
jgi:hypothetical protein